MSVSKPTSQQTVLITGATGALGKVIARALANAGYPVVLNYRTDKKTAEKMARSLPGAKTICADVTDAAAVRAMFKTIGPVAVLINTVGNFIYQPLQKTSNRAFADCVTNNLFSAWYCINSALPGMRKTRFGRIINFGSAGSDQLTARPFTAPYYVAKSGLLILTKSLARELVGSGITVNMVSPGILPTSDVHPAGAPVVSLDDIVRAVLFLLNDISGAVNGANLDVTAGWRPE